MWALYKYISGTLAGQIRILPAAFFFYLCPFFPAFFSPALTLASIAHIVKVQTKKTLYATGHKFTLDCKVCLRASV
jgi:hypothetical protein